MAREIEGDLSAEGKRFGIVVARWHERFTESLLEAAVGTLERHGAESDEIEVYRCPGSFEIPQVADRVAESTEVDALICLGVLVRGETPHFDYIAGETTAGIGRVGAEYGIPVSYGVLTCDTMEQAMARSGSKAGNKGNEAATAAIEMANLFEEIESR